MKKKIISALLILSISLSFAGCSSPIEITIVDGLSETSETVDSGKTVEEILNECEIELGSKDKTDPELTQTVDEDGTTIEVLRYAKVTVIDDGEKTTVTLTGKKVSDALEKAGITLGDNDVTDVELDTYLTDGMEINVLHSKKVVLSVGGKKSTVTTDCETVADLLEEQNITLGKNDRLSPDSDTKITNNMKVKVDRVKIKKKTKTVTVKYEQVVEYSDSLDSGEEKITQQGVNGKKKVTYKITYVNGKVEKKKAIKTKTVKKAVDEIVVKGTKSQTETETTSSTSTPSAEIIKKGEAKAGDGWTHVSGSVNGYKDNYNSTGCGGEDSYWELLFQNEDGDIKFVKVYV